jgi:hypothetical protein
MAAEVGGQREANERSSSHAVDGNTLRPIDTVAEHLPAHHVGKQQDRDQQESEAADRVLEQREAPEKPTRQPLRHAWARPMERQRQWP